MVAMITTPRLMAVGGGALGELPGMLARLSLARPLIVTDPFLFSSDHFDRATGQLDRAGVVWKVFSDTVPDPTTAVVATTRSPPKSRAQDRHSWQSRRRPAPARR